MGLPFLTPPNPSPPFRTFSSTLNPRLPLSRLTSLSPPRSVPACLGRSLLRRWSSEFPLVSLLCVVPRPVPCPVPVNPPRLESCRLVDGAPLPLPVGFRPALPPAWTAHHQPPYRNVTHPPAYPDRHILQAEPHAPGPRRYLVRPPFPLCSPPRRFDGRLFLRVFWGAPQPPWEGRLAPPPTIRFLGIRDFPSCVPLAPRVDFSVSLPGVRSRAYFSRAYQSANVCPYESLL